MAFLTPLAFCFCGYFFLYLLLSPVLEPAANVWSMVTAGLRQQQGEDLTINRLDGYTESVPSSLITFPSYGDRFGEIAIPNAGIQAPLYFGDSKALLKKGACQYMGSSFVGSGSTVLISAHNNTYFHTLGQAKVGDTVLLRTNYGDYTYEVERTGIYTTSDDSAYDLLATEENLVLYTCYPFNMLGLTAKRYFVFCRYVSGPKILYNE